MTKIKKLALLTSGGDSPGMNAAIRAVVRKAIHHDLKVVGILHGYEGLINEDFITMNSKSVGNIIQHGGTILKTARSERFMTKEGRKTAYDNLVKNQKRTIHPFIYKLLLRAFLIGYSRGMG